jgi:hypothetical protein
MRPGAILPIICACAAVALSFLCLFAGHKPGWMEDYHIMTLNTSRVGQNFINDTDATSHLPSFLANMIHNITSSINNDVDAAIESIAKQLGLEDFYSYHMLDYCYGQYEPQPVPSGNVTSKDIHKNVTGCSNQTAMFHFDPDASLQLSLDDNHVSITLDDLHWPKEIQDNMNNLRVAAKATFVLYCIGIGLALVALFTSLIGCFSSGRVTAFINILVSILAFLAIGIASGIVTAVMVKGTDTINKYGKDIGVDAKRGNKYLALTWAATGAMFLATMIWTLECLAGSRRRTHRRSYHHDKAVPTTP